jgi:Ni/Co efflux regulator RcnB
MWLDQKRRQKWVTAVAVLVATMFVAGPALADNRGRDNDRRHHQNRQYDRHQDRHQARHYNQYDRRHDRRQARRHYPVYRHGAYRAGHESAGYYCGPCNNRFNNYEALSHHVHRTHHIAIWQLPFVIVHSIFQGAFGWVFHG